MRTSDEIDGASFIAGLLVGIFVASSALGLVAIKYNDDRNVLQSEAIARGVARYHPQTGQWEWTVPEVNEARP